MASFLPQYTNKKKSAKPKSGGGTRKPKVESIETVGNRVRAALDRYKDRCRCITSNADFLTYMDEIPEDGFVAIDTETSSLQPRSCELIGFSMCYESDEAVYLPINHVDSMGKPLPNQIGIDAVREAFEQREDIRWIMHNAKFDIQVFRSVNIELKCFWDTMLSHRCLNENDSAALKNIYQQYIDKDAVDADYKTLFGKMPFAEVPLEYAYVYGAVDAYKTIAVYMFHVKHLESPHQKRVYKLFREIEMPIVDVVVDMEWNGIDIDMDVVNALHDEFSEKLADVEKYVQEEISKFSKDIENFKNNHLDHGLDDFINIGSVKQLKNLYAAFGVTLKSTDKKALQAIIDGEHTGHEIAAYVLEYRNLKKRLSTYIDAMPKYIQESTGRIHPSFNQSQAGTGRFSGQDPNMQNIPRGDAFRSMFYAGDDYAFVSGDYSQQEPRILTHLSGDANFKKAYEDGLDIYAHVGSIVYKLPYEECLEFYPDGTVNKEGKERRMRMKILVLALMYGLGNRAMAEQIGSTTEEARKIKEQFFREFPAIRRWQYETKEFGREYGYVETIWGRKRRLPDLMLEPYVITKRATSSDDFLEFNKEFDDTVPDKTKKIIVAQLNKQYANRDPLKQSLEKKYGVSIRDNTGYIANAERQAVNARIQGSAADMTKLAMIDCRADARMRSINSVIVMPEHDEIVTKCPRSNVEAAGERLRDIMIGCCADKIDVPMKVDIAVSYHWDRPIEKEDDN
jgi:DNA polymerase I-like protein with 3'-5' exonuclease and polymerase domains